jgi:hypothetical protein
MQRGVDEAKRLFPSLSEFSIEYRNPKTTEIDGLKEGGEEDETESKPNGSV